MINQRALETLEKAYALDEARFSYINGVGPTL